jgi:hypothetical protein
MNHTEVISVPLVHHRGKIHKTLMTFSLWYLVEEAEEDCHQEGALQGGAEVPEGVLHHEQDQQVREVGTYM